MAGAPTVTLWRTDAPQREFLHGQDFASAYVRLLEVYDDPTLINVGTGEDIPIGELAHLINDDVGCQGDIFWDTTRPDGTPSRVLSVDPMSALECEPAMAPPGGIRATWGAYFAEVADAVDGGAP